MGFQPSINGAKARGAKAGDRRRFAGPAIVLAAAAVAIAPQLIRGNSCGHDFNVHLVSWIDCLNSWRHGIVYPHWTASPNYGAGEPRFVFYPPLTWMLGAVLGLLFNWHAAPIVFTFLCLAGTGLATRALALEIYSEPIATLAGCAALFSGFTLFTAYERTAFPEFTGGVWLPLLLLFALRDRSAGAPLEHRVFSRAFSGATVPLAVMLAASWLSNAPLGVIASYLLAAVALLAALLRKSLAPVLRAAVAAALGLGITAFYWFPAALERRWVDIRQATEDPGYNFENNWAFARHADPSLALHDHVLRQASFIAVSMIAVALAGLAVCWLRGAIPGKLKPVRPGPNGRATASSYASNQTSSCASSCASSHTWVVLAAIPAATLFLLFPVSRPIWRLPEMPYLQYPWRWLEAVEAPMAIFFAAAVWPAGRRARLAVVSACAALLLGATAFAGTYFFQVCYPEDTVPSVLAEYRAGAGFEGMFEYEPPNSDETLIATGLPTACLVGDSTTELGQPDPDGGNPVWTPGQHSCLAAFAGPVGSELNPEHRRMQIDAPASGYLVLRLLSYPAWRIRVNGRAVTSLPRRDDGLIAVPVARGSVDLDLDWTTTADVRASRWISALSLLLLALFGLLERRLAAIGRKPAPDQDLLHSPVSSNQ